MNREDVGDLLRELAPHVLGTLLRRHGQFDACEEAVQEAMLAATQQWPANGVHLPTRRARRYPSDTTEDEWRSLAPLVPVGGTCSTIGGVSD